MTVAQKERPRSVSSGYRVIQSAEIQNFRGFRQVELSGLARVNILVGDNGAGKTALLEALFLALATSPEIALRLRGWRGVDAPAGMGTMQEVYDGLFLDLFHKFGKERTPSISVRSSNGNSRTLTFYYDPGEPTPLPLEETGQAHSGPYTPITFEWKDGEGKTTKVTPKIQANTIAIPPAAQLKHDTAFLAARVAIPTSQNARWFSEFSKRGDERRFISAVQAQFGQVETLTVEVDMGNPVIFVKVPWIERKIPIYLASDGLNKLVTLILHIAHCRGSALFVDEFENGFHFSRHRQLWEQLLAFAEDYETQLFVTTHSWECLTSVAPLIDRSPDNFSLVQVTQRNGVCSAVVVSGKDAAAAIENEIEVRR